MTKTQQTKTETAAAAVGPDKRRRRSPGARQDLTAGSKLPGRNAGATSTKRAKSSAPTAPAASPAATSSTSIAMTPRQTKKALITSLLQRAEGAAVTELMTATGWLGHSVRAALTGLRQEGHQIVRGKAANGAAQYRITAGT